MGIISAKTLYGISRKHFDSIPDARPAIYAYALSDVLMSGLAIFALKSPSLLAFDKSVRNNDSILNTNLQNLFEITAVPSDTQLRTRLDEVDPAKIQPAFKKILALAQRQNVLKNYKFMDIGYLVALDGTGFYSSNTVHCNHCMTKQHRDETITYHHQALGGVIIHPNMKQVLPFAPEFICNADGTTKNDCERNAAKRLLTRLREEHPKFPFIITEDSLSSNAPHILLLRELNMNFILGVKPGDHEYLFNQIDLAEKEGRLFSFVEILDNVEYKIKFLNSVQLNASTDTKVNFLSVTITNKNGIKTVFSWVTSIAIKRKNWFEIMKGGRARWKIENETFNTLKNQGYNFEHNFGHGEKHLCNTFGTLMFLAFLIDQLQEICCQNFKDALVKSETKRDFWLRIKCYVLDITINNWVELYNLISKKIKLSIAKTVLDTT